MYPDSWAGFVELIAVDAGDGDPFMLVMDASTGSPFGGQVLIIGDHNLFHDSLITNPANTALFENIIEWAGPIE